MEQLLVDAKALYNAGNSEHYADAVLIGSYAGRYGVRVVAAILYAVYRP